MNFTKDSRYVAEIASGALLMLVVYVGASCSRPKLLLWIGWQRTESGGLGMFVFLGWVGRRINGSWILSLSPYL